MDVLAIIPARGGSKGIPHKNIVPGGGKPLVAWTLTAALKAERVTRVVVSTDDDKIARVAKRYGAEVVKRPADISGDTASSESALLHVLETLKKTENYMPELVVFLQATSPLTTAGDIDRCVEKLITEKADTAFTATPFHYFVWKKEADGGYAGVNHDKRTRPRRQDREPQYLENGAVYVMRIAGFLQTKHRFFGKTVISEMPAERCFEIDEPHDLIHAEWLLRQQQKGDVRHLLPPQVKGIVFEFDGVMTDNRVRVSADGKESVVCSRSDGWGIEKARGMGLKMAIMSSETDGVVMARAKKLKIECYHQLGHDKGTHFTKWCATNGLNPEEVIYVGNDENDIECLTLSGCGVVPADAHESAKRAAKIILKNKGGKGAVRELIDLIADTE